VTGRPRPLAERGAAAWAETGVVVLLGAVLLLPGLGGYPLLDPSEARHAAVARQMARTDSWLVPVLYGVPYYDKPAPYYWLLRAAARLPVAAETAARLPSAIATLACAVVLQRFARPRFGAPAALLAAAVFVTSPATVALGRSTNPDAVLATAVTAAAVAWLAWMDRPAAPPWAAYALMGLGALVKGPVAIVLPLLVAGASAVARGVLRARIRAAALVRGLALSTAILLAWLSPAAIADPRYAAAFLLQHNVDRYVTGDVGHPHAFWFLVPALLAMVLPWSLALPAALAAGSPWRSTGDGDAAVHERDAWLWAVVIVAFFSVGRAKLPAYVLPAIAPLALWLASRLVRLARLAAATADRRFDGEREREPRERWLRGALALWAAVLLAAPIAIWTYLRFAFPRFAELAWRAWPLPVAALLGLALAWRTPARLRGTALSFACGNAVVLVLAYAVGAPLVSRVASDVALARIADDLAPGVPLVGFRIHPASLSFYSASTVRKLRDVDDVVAIARAGPLLVVTRAEDAEALQRAGLALHQWTECERHCLWGTMPRPGVAALVAAAPAPAS